MSVQSDGTQVTTQCAFAEKPIDPPSMIKAIHSAMLVYLIVLPVVASDQEDTAADAAAKAFLHARQAAHRSKLERMGRNTFREKACKRDMRFASGWINDVVYEISDPADLPDLAQKLTASPDTGRTAVRFGIGVCMQSNSSPGRPKYSVLIATYESRWTSFWRIFWE